ncbi:MAG: EAL domain-containing protein [Desulfurobacteriaceae bacterium]
MSETLGKIRGLGGGILAKREITVEERKEIIDLYNLLVGYRSLVFWTIQNGEVPKSIVKKFSKAEEKINEFIRIIEDLFLLNKEKPSSDPVKYFNMSTVVIDELFNIYNLIFSHLDQFLKSKRSLLVKDLILKSLIIFFLVGGLLYLSVLIYKITIESLHSILLAARSISKGNFNVKILTNTKDEIGEVAKVLTISVDKLKKTIEELERSKQQLQYLLTYDSLTELPNRVKLLEDIKTLKKPALCIMDISDFRSLNELYGEECGDFVLKQIASELKRFESKIHPYRVYSDEFALLYDLEEGRINFKEFSSYCAETINYLEDKPLRYKDFDIYLNFTAGIAEGDKEKLLVHAEMALNEAKEKRKKLIVVDSNHLKKHNYAENMFWIRKIKKAIEEKRIVPFYQPIINNKTGKIEKFEALVRLLDKDGNVISPRKFLPIAKKARLYPEITKIVTEKVFEDFRKLPSEVSVNISFEDLLSEKTVNFIFNELKKFPEPHRITFEILETEEIENYKLFYQFISEVKNFGCKFAIDDFGTGYSNLEHLMKLNVDFLKIDASIIKRILESREALILTEAVVSFSKKLNIKTVAEFVSNEAIYEAVKKLGIDYSQGYFLGEPQPIEEVERLITSS